MYTFYLINKICKLCTVNNFMQDKKNKTEKLTWHAHTSPKPPFPRTRYIRNVLYVTCCPSSHFHCKYLIYKKEEENLIFLDFTKNLYIQICTRWKSIIIKKVTNLIRVCTMWISQGTYVLWSVNNKDLLMGWVLI